MDIEHTIIYAEPHPLRISNAFLEESMDISWNHTLFYELFLSLQLLNQLFPQTKRDPHVIKSMENSWWENFYHIK